MNLVLGGLCEPLPVVGGFGGYAVVITVAIVTPDPDRATWLRAAATPDPDRATWVLYQG